LPEQITIIAENRCALSRGLIAEHGFSALIELDGFHLLFDTGQGFALQKNQALLQYDLAKINGLVLSHGHYDHTGGINYVLEKNPRLKIFLHPAALCRRRARKELAGKVLELDVGMPISRKEMEDRGAELVFVEKALELADGRILISGPIPLKLDFEKPEPGFLIEKNGQFVPDDFPDDLALAVRGKNGVSVLFGCAHRGAINTLNRIDGIWGVKKLDLLMGGTHLLSRSKEELEKSIDQLARFNPGRIAVGHCTGDEVLCRLAQRFPDRFIFPASGLKLQI